jgi:hypothetical protein
MTREQMFEGYLAVQQLLFAWNAFGERLLAMLRGIRYTPDHARKGMLADPVRLARIRKTLPRLVRAAAPVRAVAFKLLSWTASPQSAEGLGVIQKLTRALPGEARPVFAAVLEETLTSAPWLLNTIVYKMFLHIENIRGLDRMRAELRRRLEIEKLPATAPGCSPPSRFRPISSASTGNPSP